MDEKLRNSVLDLLCEVYRYNVFMSKMAAVAVSIQPNNEKKVNGASLRLGKKLKDIQDLLNVEVLFISGEYSPELPITPLNIDDFEVGDKLLIGEIIEPVIKEKDTSNIVRMGKVLLRKLG